MLLLPALYPPSLERPPTRIRHPIGLKDANQLGPLFETAFPWRQTHPILLFEPGRDSAMRESHAGFQVHCGEKFMYTPFLLSKMRTTFSFDEVLERLNHSCQSGCNRIWGNTIKWFATCNWNALDLKKRVCNQGLIWFDLLKMCHTSTK